VTKIWWTAAAANDHHERGVGLVEVGEIVKRGMLIEGAEVGDWSAPSERHDDAVADPRGERVAPRRVSAAGICAPSAVNATSPATTPNGLFS